MEFTDKSCKEYIEVLSSREPVPGGGGASAIVGSIGMALGNMVGALTHGKERYAEFENDIIEFMEKARRVQKELIELSEKDAIVFEPLAKAYSMPRNTEKEKKEKDKVMAVVLKDACLVPLEIMKKCAEAIDLHGEFAKKGSHTAISDVGTGVIFCKSALQGAALNVFINTKYMKDKAYADKVNAEADKLLGRYTTKANSIYFMVSDRLRNEKEITII